MISYYWWIFCFSSFSASFTDDNKKHPLCQTISINLIANWRLTADSKNLTAYSMPHTKGWSSIQDDWWTRLQWWKHGQNKICKLCSDKWEMLVAINNRENVSLSNCRKLWLETDKQVFSGITGYFLGSSIPSASKRWKITRNGRLITVLALTESPVRLDRSNYRTVRRVVFFLDILNFGLFKSRSHFRRVVGGSHVRLKQDLVPATESISELNQTFQAFSRMDLTVYRASCDEGLGQGAIRGDSLPDQIPFAWDRNQSKVVEKNLTKTRTFQNICIYVTKKIENLQSHFKSFARC